MQISFAPSNGIQWNIRDARDNEAFERFQIR